MLRINNKSEKLSNNNNNHNKVDTILNLYTMVMKVYQSEYMNK